jgi:hypothetical protein
MRRILIGVVTAVALCLSAFLTAGSAQAALPSTGKVYDGTHPGTFVNGLKPYTVTRTVGPFNGQAKDGDPGFPQSNGEADVIQCRQEGDTILTGSATILRTTSRGTSRHDTLDVHVIGAFDNTEAGRLQWGAFITPNGNKGWNSVKFSLTCAGRS